MQVDRNKMCGMRIRENKNKEIKYEERRKNTVNKNESDACTHTQQSEI
jgi:hypothetical protein